MSEELVDRLRFLVDEYEAGRWRRYDEVKAAMREAADALWDAAARIRELEGENDALRAERDRLWLLMQEIISHVREVAHDEHAESLYRKAAALSSDTDGGEG